MTKGDGIFSDDFFRTRPKRDELHNFIEVAKPPAPKYLEARVEIAPATVDFELHIAHQKKEEGVMFLHIPHRVAASRLTRKEHLAEGNMDSVSGHANLLTMPVRQVKKTGSSPVRLSIFEKAHKSVPKSAVKLLKIEALATPVHVQRVSPLMIESLTAKNKLIRKNIPGTPVPVIRKKTAQISKRHSPAKGIVGTLKISSTKRSQAAPIITHATIYNAKMFAASGIPIVLKQLPAAKVMMRRSILRTVRQTLPLPIPVQQARVIGSELFSATSVPVIPQQLPTAKVMMRRSILRTVHQTLPLPIPVQQARVIGSELFSATSVPVIPQQLPTAKVMMQRSIQNNMRRVIPLMITTPAPSKVILKRFPARSVPILQQQQPTAITMHGIVVSIPSRKKIRSHVLAIPEQAFRTHKAVQEQRRKEIAQAIQLTIDTTRGEFSRLGKLKPVAPIPSPAAIPSYIHAAPAVQMQQKYASPVMERPITKKLKKKSCGIKKVLGETTRFAITSALIFGISFSVMNAPALSQLMMARLDPVATVAQQIALENMTEVNTTGKPAPILPTAGMKRETHAVFPALAIQPAPLENRIVIPKIGKNIPIVDVPNDSLLKSDWTKLEKDIQEALRDGVVRYPGTAEPGQVGNVFITGHSSYYLWDKGKYKDVFTRLHDLDVGDEFTIFWEQDVHHYRIRERKVVSPEETSVLKQPQSEKIATLMTCTPIGTAKDRLILVADET